MNKLLSKDELHAAAIVIRAINNKMRLNILHLLDKQERLTVTDIQERCKLEQSVCSSHLAILRKAGIVGVERAGKNRLYYIDQHRLLEINLFIKAII